MTEFVVSPIPEITLSDADEHTLPITSFHLVVIVEADPETYMPLPGDMKLLGEVIYSMYSRFDAEIDPDNPDVNPSNHPTDVEETVFIWLRYDDDYINYFKSFTTNPFPKATFTLFDPEDTEHLEYYLKGVKTIHPDWRVGVIGAMYEDEVIQIANFFQTTGFSTTVLIRYCLSNKVFVNLDNLLEYETWQRTAGREEGEPFRSWLDDWLEEHGIDLEDEGDFAEE